MKRYLVFAGAHYYPEGGWRDLVLMTDDYQEAVDEGQKVDSYGVKEYDWSEIVDTQSCDMVNSITNW